MTQPSLLENLRPRFDGATFDVEADADRLTNQLAKVKALMDAGAWWTLAELHAAIPEASEAGISARLRDLRKSKHGSHQIDRRRRTVGQWEYKLVRE